MNQDDQELKNGLEPTLDRRAESDFRLVLDSDAPDNKAPSQHTTLVIPREAVVSATIIISVGGVAGLLYFMYLCFVYPSAANIVVPVMLAGIGALVAEIMRVVRDRKARAAAKGPDE